MGTSANRPHGDRRTFELAQPCTHLKVNWTCPLSLPHGSGFFFWLTMATLLILQTMDCSLFLNQLVLTVYFSFVS